MEVNPMTATSKLRVWVGFWEGVEIGGRGGVGWTQRGGVERLVRLGRWVGLHGGWGRTGVVEVHMNAAPRFSRRIERHL